MLTRTHTRTSSHTHMHHVHTHTHIKQHTFPPKTAPVTAAEPRFLVFVTRESWKGQSPPADSDMLHFNFILGFDFCVVAGLNSRVFV